MYCSNCGAERSDSSGAFCRVCGARRTPDPEPADQVEYPPSRYPDYAPAPPTAPSSSELWGRPSSAPTPWRPEPTRPQLGSPGTAAPQLGSPTGAIAARPIDQTRLLVLIGVAVLVLAAGFGLGYLLTGIYLPAS